MNQLLQPIAPFYMISNIIQHLNDNRNSTKPQTKTIEYQQLSPDTIQSLFTTQINKTQNQKTLYPLLFDSLPTFNDHCTKLSNSIPSEAFHSPYSFSLRNLLIWPSMGISQTAPWCLRQFRKCLSLCSKYIFLSFTKSGQMAVRDKQSPVPMHTEAMLRSMISFPAVTAENLGEIFCIMRFMPIDDTAPTARYVEMFFSIDWRQTYYCWEDLNSQDLGSRSNTYFRSRMFRQLGRPSVKTSSFYRRVLNECWKVVREVERGQGDGEVGMVGVVIGDKDKEDEGLMIKRRVKSQQYD